MLTLGLINLIFLFGAGFLGGIIATRSQRGNSRPDREIQEIRERLLRLEQSIETMSGDVERVSEGHRFLTALLEDRSRGRPSLPGPEPDKGH
jgi:hypothetical protein